MSKKEVSVVVASFDEVNDPEFVFPSKYSFRAGNGDFIFVKTNKKAIAEQYVQEHYEGKYSIRVM